MAELDNNAKNELAADLMSKLSAIREPIVPNKGEFLAFISVVDTRLEETESNIVSDIPAGPAKDWLVANPQIARRMVEEIMKKRREEL